MIRAIVVIVVLLAVVVGVAKSRWPHSKAVEPAPAAADIKKAPRAAITVDAAASSCVVTPADATIRVYVTFRNTGGAGTASIIPVRRYDDGSTNESMVDSVSTSVPAHTVKRAFADFDYDAVSHDLISCGVRTDDGVTVPLRIVVG